MRTLRKPKGFTLIELLIVIVIIGVLATAIIINVRNAAPAARKNTAVSNLNRTISAANACISEGYSLSTAITQGTTPVCGNTAASVEAKWPTLNGYTYTPIVTATGINSINVTRVTGTTNPDITCTGTPLSCQ